jgi:hypothetical protein
MMPPARRATAALLGAIVALGWAPGQSSATRNLARCVPASSVLAGSRNGVIYAATHRSGSGNFQLRRAGRAGPGDLNYESLASTCSRAMVRRTWYTDLHPRGMQCGACDSHEYWVKLRHGGWATLAYFSG